MAVDSGCAATGLSGPFDTTHTGVRVCTHTLRTRASVCSVVVGMCDGWMDGSVHEW